MSPAKDAVQECSLMCNIVFKSLDSKNSKLGIGPSNFEDQSRKRFESLISPTHSLHSGVMVIANRFAYKEPKRKQRQRWC